MMLGLAVLLANLTCVLMMAGSVWIRQLVYYPLFSLVGAEEFPDYQRENRRRVQRSLQPAQVMTILTTLLLVIFHPAAVPLGLVLAGVLAEALGAAVTVYEVRRQRRLEEGFDVVAHRQLLAGNWFRTAALSVHSGLMIWMLAVVAIRT